MKEHVQTTGIRKWAGEDLIELQSESLSALQQSFAEYGNCVIAGCHVEKVGAQYNITPGIVGLMGVDVSGVEAYKMLQFQGQKNVVLPAFFVMESVVNEREYADGAVKPISYTYRAVLNNVEPTGEYLRIDASGAKTYKDAVGISSKLEKDGSGDAVTATFTTPTTRSNITSGSTLRILFGTIRKWFSDLKALAFKDKVAKSDLDASLTTEFNNKVDKITGKALSTNDYTTAEKTKLRDIAAGAEVNVQADWAEGNMGADAYIKNKPTALPASGGDADTVGGKSSSAFEPAFTKGTAFNKNFGSAAGTVCQGNDSRLTNARVPSGTAGGDLTGTYPNPTIKENVTLNGTTTINGDISVIGNTHGIKEFTSINNDDGIKMWMRADGREGYLNFDGPGLSRSILNIGKDGNTLGYPISHYAFWEGNSLGEVVAAQFTGNLDGIAKSAIKLSTSRTINGVAFNGTQNISISAPPSGTAGGDLVGTYPTPTIKESVILKGNPTIAGNLRLQTGSSVSGNKLNFGDGDLVYLHEATDNKLTIKAKEIIFDGPANVTTVHPDENSSKVPNTSWVRTHVNSKYLYCFAKVYNKTLTILEQNFVTGIKRVSGVNGLSAYQINTNIDLSGTVFQISRITYGGGFSNIVGAYEKSPFIISSTSTGLQSGFKFYVVVPDGNYQDGFVLSGWRIG